MPRSLSPIPAGMAITDREGTITVFFRLAWQLLVDGFQITPDLAAFDATAQSAAIATTTLADATAGGQYRINTSLTRTITDGVSSSAAITIGFSQGGVARTVVLAALTEASGLAYQGASTPIYADANSAITVAMSYASNTAAKAKFDLHVTAEQMA